MISSTNAAYNLTISNTASPGYSLRVMTVVAVVFFPIVLCYQIWGYYTFRKRLSVPRTDGSGDPVDPAPTETAAPAEST
jgi:cytochrome d ubiquinol oxidase subunit II